MFEYKEKDVKNKKNIDNKIKWDIDKAHSRIQFAARHMVISEVMGQFRDYELKLTTNGLDFENADLEFYIKPESLDTGIVDRDNHLRSEDFFAVTKFDTITYKNKSIKKVDDESFKLKGDLTIRDVTKEIELDVEYGGLIKDPYGLYRAGFQVRGSLDRFEYNLKWNNLIETGGAVVGKKIKIICDVEVTTPAQ